MLGEVPLGGGLPLRTSQLPGVPRGGRSHGLEGVRRSIRGVVDDDSDAVVVLDVRELARAARRGQPDVGQVVGGSEADNRAGARGDLWSCVHRIPKFCVARRSRKT